MSFRLTCISTVCSTARVDKHERMHQSFALWGGSSGNKWRHHTLGQQHYNDVIMSAMASQITSLTIVCPTVCSFADQRIHQSSASLAFVRGIHRWPMNSPHKGPVTRKKFPFDDVIMNAETFNQASTLHLQCEKAIIKRQSSALLVACKGIRQCEQWIHRTQNLQYKRHESCNSMTITQVFVGITHKQLASLQLVCRPFIPSIWEIVITISTLTALQSELRFFICVYNTHHWQPEYKCWVTFMMVFYWRTCNDQVFIKWCSLLDTHVLTQNNFIIFQEKYHNFKDTKRAVGSSH